MREILFKAKAIISEEWVEGSLVILSESDYRIVTKYDSECAYTSGSNYDGDMSVVDPSTICQYTGLTDKNGCKIWENDVLRGHENPNDLAKVVFGEFAVIEVESLEKVDGVIGWHTEVIPTDALSKCEPFCLPMPLTDFYIKHCEWEVIGSIFDSPELLKGE